MRDPLKMGTTADLMGYAPQLKVTPYDGDILDDLIVMRYLEDWKFDDLLETKTLYFRREDLLRALDPNEGRVSKRNIESDALLANDSAAVIQRELRRQFIELGPVNQTFTTCWYMGDREDPVMYKEFAPENGVVIYSTVGRLRALCGGPSPAKAASIAPIKYILFHEDMMNEDTDHFPMYFKSDGFKHQNELRFMVMYTIYYMTGPHGVYKGQWPEYERVPIAFGDVITEVRVAPTATRDYAEATALRLQALGIADRLRPSELT